MWSEAYSEPCQTSTMELLAKIINSWKPFTIFTESSIVEFCEVLNTLLFGLMNFMTIQIPDQKYLVENRPPVLHIFDSIPSISPFFLETWSLYRDVLKGVVRSKINIEVIEKMKSAN